ncbi:unnamed protein product [Auanema sp. JU1783]|nr:unnamed protein product [Auanema sp. JU1783]
MDETHSLLLNEEALKVCPDPKKPIFIYEWLRYLDSILPVTQRVDLKSVQEQLLKQLESRVLAANGAPTRLLLARCIARVYATGDSYSLFGTINMCNDVLRGKDDSPSQLPIKLSALACLSALYENVGRLVGRSYEETFTAMCKMMKSAESQIRTEILSTMSAMITGLGAGASNVHKDFYKVAKTYLTDRAPTVRVAAIRCLTSLVPLYPVIYTTDLEGTCTLCVKALDGSTYETRLAVANLFAILLSTSLQPPPGATMGGKGNTNIPIRPMPLEDALQLLSAGFLRGGIGGFLKGNSGSAAASGGLREVRVGIAMGYVELFREMGTNWLEKNVGMICKHLLDVCAKTGGLAFTNSNSQANEAVSMRGCISYVFRASIGTMLSEQAQITACKYLGALLSDYINSFDCSVEPGVESVFGPEIYSSAQACMVALLEISALVRQIGTAVTPLFVEASGIMEPVFASLLHPVQSVRVASAWCLRCVTLAVPSQLTPLIDRCLSRLEHMKASTDAISGYSLALAALIAASADCKLGIPHAKPKQVFNCAEEMLKTATQQSRLAIAKINAGWMLLHSLVSLGPCVVKSYMPKICQMWRAAFPRSAKEAENEKGRGDAFSWQCALESRAGALSVMCAAVSQKDLADDEIIKSVLLPVECSLVMMSQVGSLVRSYGNKIRQLLSYVRIRVYQLVIHLPTKTYENVYAALLRELVADITLSDNVQSSQTSSLPSQLTGGPESVLLTPWFNANDQALIENQLQTGNSCVGSMENDVMCLISGNAKDLHSLWPTPDPPHVACLDTAVQAYAKVFYLAPAKHKLQITEHFSETIKGCKQVARQQAIQQNVVCALAGAFKTVCESRSRLDNESLQKASLNILVNGLSSPSAISRCVSAEALGRLAQAAGDPQYVASIAQYCFDRLKTLRDSISRSGFTLALGCLHRHVGSLGSGQHLNTGVSVVLALSQDFSQPLVQTWSLVSLALIAETGGGMFRGYVEPVLSVCLILLLNTQAGNVDVVQGIGKLLSALMTCVGPELGCTGAIEGVRGSLLVACALQFSHPDPLVRSEALAGLQQMHLYAPRYVHLNRLVHDICRSLSSRHLCVRKAAVCCLRQLVQREAKEVHEHAQVLVPQGMVDEGKKLPLPDTGLEGALISMLDTETHSQLRLHLEETVVSLVQATNGELLSQWLSLCKDILASSTESTKVALGTDDATEKEDDEKEDGGDDDVTLAVKSNIIDKGKVQPRWPTRVFATQVVQKLMSVCDTERAHLDLALAKELQMSSNGRCDYLVLHLSDLVRMSFMGATSSNTELRLAGLLSLQEVINRFSTVPEPEFPGHVILEQFQAQVGAALRPAFTEDTPSHVTAAACQVCSTWIGSGVARDLNDLRRVHQLLVSSLGKLKHGSINTQLYSEAAATLEKVSILKAWAEVYVTAIEQESKSENDDSPSPNESLLSLVQPELSCLIGYWLAALHDAAVLSLPAKFVNQLPGDGGAFFKMESSEVCREYYRAAWPPILLASTMWFKQNSFEKCVKTEAPETWSNDKAESRFHVMFGLAVEALCSKTAFNDDATIQMCLKSLTALISCEWCQLHLMSDIQLAIELTNVLHRLILTRDNLSTQQLCMECANTILDAAFCSIRLSSSADIENGNITSPLGHHFDGFKGEEGSEGLKSGTLTFGLLELVLCLFIRQMPQINSAQMKSRSVAPLHLRRFGRLPPESATLIKGGIQLLVQLPNLCCSKGKGVVLPVVLYLLIGFIRESARIDEGSVVPDLPPGHLTTVATTALQALRTIASSPPTDATLEQWTSLMRSALYSMLLLCSGAHRVDECVIMLSCVILVSSAPKSVIMGHSDSLNRLVVILRNQLQSDNYQVVCKALQSLNSLFSRRDISSLFIHRLGKYAFEPIKTMVTGEHAGNVKDITDDQLAVVQEAVKTMEVLITAAKEEKRLSTISLLVQALCRMLCATSADEWRQLSASARRLQEFTITRLNAIAPNWPKEFKNILNVHPNVKHQLESALLLQASRQSLSQQLSKAKANEAKMNTTHQPSIKLTMDFNAFGKAAS